MDPGIPMLEAGVGRRRGRQQRRLSMAQSWAGISPPLGVVTLKASSNSGGPHLRTLHHVAAPRVPGRHLSATSIHTSLSLHLCSWFSELLLPHLSPPFLKPFPLPGTAPHPPSHLSCLSRLPFLPGSRPLSSLRKNLPLRQQVASFPHQCPLEPAITRWQWDHL